jgi:allantoin racemase
MAYAKGSSMELRNVRVIVPLFITREEAEGIKKFLEGYAWDGTVIDVIGLQESIAVNSRSEADVATTELMDLLAKAEKDGCNAVVSYCYVDVGVDAAKCFSKIPVIGPLEASTIVANMLGMRYSVISVGATYPPGEFYILPRLRSIGLDKNYVSTRGIHFEKFFVFSKNARHVKAMRSALIKECKKALGDGAHTLIFGCTGFPPAKDLGIGLNVPIIDAPIALKVAECLVDLKSDRSEMEIQGQISNKDRECDGVKTRIKLLIPASAALDPSLLEKLRGFVNEGTKIDQTAFEKGPESIKSPSDLAKVLPFIIKEAARAEAEGYGAVVISSFVDPGLESAREVCQIPIMGLGESSILLSCLIGMKASIIIREDWMKPLLEKKIRKMGLEGRISQIIQIGEKNGTGWPNPDELIEELKSAIEGGADVIILGGNDAFDIVRSIRSRVGTTILDPMSAALKMAEVLHSMGLSHSKLSYPRPILPRYHKKRLEGLTRKPKGSLFLYGIGNQV